MIEHDRIFTAAIDEKYFTVESLKLLKDMKIRFGS